MNGPSPRGFSLSSGSIPSRAAGPTETLLLAIERLRDTLDDENAQIAAGKIVDFQAFNQRKSQGLLELTRLMPALAGAHMGSSLRTALTGLHARLEENQRILRVQLRAVQEVSDIIARTIQAGQSDGTYSPYSWRD
jgi:hypothetical protein